MGAVDDRAWLATLRKSEKLRGDSRFVLWRAQTAASGSVLVLAPAEAEPAGTLLSHLANEYALKDRLDAEWAATPLALVEQGASAELVLADPGGDVLEHFLRDLTPSESGHGGLDVEGFLALGLQIAEAMAKLHDRDIVHKDVRPANILIGPDGRSIWFTGFGFASPLPRHHQAPEPVETIEGTLAYMAPEQTGRMNRSVDCRSDLYSLGITFFEMLTGQTPFTSDDPVELVHFHVARRPTPPSRLRSDLPPQVSDVVMKLLAKPAEDRYQTANGLAADLRQCLNLWRQTRSVPAFRLGVNDLPNRLAIPEKLYGRDDDLRRLLAATNRATTEGAFEIVLVSGYSGVGKSALVGELHKALIEPRALYAMGKFDQYKRHIPYATLAQAFQGVIRAILGQTDEQLARWRRAILDGLGKNGRLIAELIPELSLLIGEPPPVPELPPNDAQNRFFSTFRRFLTVWATEDHPLVLFLDDLQWVDPGSLKLLEHLAAQGGLSHLLLICAYRDNEVGPTHPFTLAFEAIRTRMALEEIVLQPLSLDHIGQMVAEALSCAPARAQPLVELIASKTGGNPFFTIQFMQGLFEDRLLRPGIDGWHWNIDQISAKDFTDNVVDLMVGKLRRLPQTTQDVMRQLAYMGNVVSVRNLQIVHETRAGSLDDDLDEALRGSYLIRRKDHIQFSHDRIQEAAYSLLPAENRPAEHLRIGRRLASCLDRAEIEDDIFETVNHFNLGIELLTDPGERQTVCRWNILAGKKAKAAAAYATARTYFAQAMDLLPPSAWEDDYEQTLWLFLERSGCELLVGNFQQVDDLFPLIVAHARTNADRAKAFRQRILRNQVAGRYGDGVDVALEALPMFGLSCPQLQTEVDAAVERARHDAAINLGGAEIGSLIDSPAMTDPDALAMVGILSDAMPCAFLARPDLYSWLVLSALNVTLRYGNTADSCAVYTGYAIVLVSIYNEIDASLQYADVALKLQEKLSRPDLKGRILVRSGVFINSRRNSLKSSIEILREGFLVSQAAGDYSYSVYGALEIAWLTFECGAHLHEFAASSRKFAAFAEQSRNTGLLYTLRAQEAFVSCLAGELSVADFTAKGAASLPALISAQFGTGIAYFHLMGQLVALLNGDYAQALERSRQVSASLKSITGWVAETTYHFLAVLTLAALDSPQFRAEHGDWQAVLTAHMDLLRARAADSPQNYRCRYLLAAAEVARITGDALEAQTLYEDAIHSAHENGFGQVEAIAFELASQFYRGRRLELIADTYLRKARDCYARWGAQVKVKQIEAAQPAGIGGGDTHGPFQNLDAISVVKASQAVSGEIALDRLVETLLRITVENAGAERGVLVVDLDGTLTVVADAHMGDGAVVVETLRQKPAGYALPGKVLNYVQHAKTRLLLDDATQDRDFGVDAYLSNSGMKSVLCLPMIKQSRLIGLLYLENSQVSHAFTADRVALLDLLASQAAISLENALLYEDLERHRDDLERTVTLRTAELREKKEQLDKILTEQDIILENASLGIVVVVPSENGHRMVRRANSAAERLFGYGPGELVGLDTRVVWPNEEEFKAIGTAYRYLAAGQTYCGEHAIRRWNREDGFGRLVGAAVDPTDLSKGSIWLVEDITERRAAEVALKAAKDLAENMANAFRHKSEQVASLLDNSGQGFLSFGADLVVDPEYSRACETMLGTSPAGKNLAALLFPADAHKAELLQMGVAMALDEGDCDRQAMILSLLPTEMQHGALILRAEYSGLDTGRVMLILTDITEERRLAEKVRSEHRCLQMVVAAVTESRDFFDSIATFRGFLGNGLPALIRSGMPVKELLEEVYREIHTFKGTLDQFSFQHTPDELHALEEQLGEMRARIESVTVAEISSCLASAPLEERFEKDLSGLSEIIGEDFLDMGERVTISADQAVRLEKLASSLLRGETIDWAAAEIRQLLLEIGYLRRVPVRDVLAGYGRTATQIAARLEKELAPIDICGGGDLWINPTIFGPFMRSLIHVFRNAVAHGIEDSDTRLNAGKDECGRIVCSVRRVGYAMELSIADDGAGIDVEAVRAKAVEKGLISAQVAAAMGEDEVLNLIFLDSLTTAPQARRFSGRGVGLAAVRSEAQKLGGTVSVRSEPGRGTAFIFTLPFGEEGDVVAA